MSTYEAKRDDCYRCDIPDTKRCPGCDRPVCLWCRRDNGFCTKGCEADYLRRQEQYKLFDDA